MYQFKGEGKICNPDLKIFKAVFTHYCLHGPTELQRIMLRLLSVAKQYALGATLIPTVSPPLTCPIRFIPSWSIDSKEFLLFPTVYKELHK